MSHLVGLLRAHISWDFLGFMPFFCLRHLVGILGFCVCEDFLGFIAVGLIVLFICLKFLGFTSLGISWDLVHLAVMRILQRRL